MHVNWKTIKCSSRTWSKSGNTDRCAFTRSRSNHSASECCRGRRWSQASTLLADHFKRATFANSGYVGLSLWDTCEIQSVNLESLDSGSIVEQIKVEDSNSAEPDKVKRNYLYRVTLSPADAAHANSSGREHLEVVTLDSSQERSTIFLRMVKVDPVRAIPQSIYFKGKQRRSEVDEWERRNPWENDQGDVEN